MEGRRREREKRSNGKGRKEKVSSEIPSFSPSAPRPVSLPSVFAFRFFFDGGERKLT